MKPQTNSSELESYLRANWQLIPLHRWNRKDIQYGKEILRGKSPLHSNWTRRPYISKNQLAHMDSGNNVGVRLRKTDLVIDVDPRNFDEGDDPLKRLCKDCQIDVSKYATVITGSGGLHIYMHKPENVSIRNTFPDYNGIEFKTKGQQVVAAGSIHPETGNNYLWDFEGRELDQAENAPELLINLIRKAKSASDTAPGIYSQDELAIMLNYLDPEKFQAHCDWLPLMQACHHATNGSGREEFIEWSTRDPKYSDQGNVIGLRWDSLSNERESDTTVVTYRTLDKAMRDSGHGSAIPKKSAEDDFDDLSPEEFDEDLIEEHERKGPLEQLNDKYWAVIEDGSFRILWEESDPVVKSYDGGIAKPRKKWIRSRFEDFKKFMATRQVQQGKKIMNIADAWLAWNGRNTAKGVLFDPESDHEGYLNLWTGWGVEPRSQGSWKYLKELLTDVLCDGDSDFYEYVLNWSAHMIQHPGSPAEVAICFQGDKGAGKSTFGRVLATLAGRHGMHITSSSQLTGRFNDHLRDVILLFADEAIRPYDKEGESRLKGLITEPYITFEGKGRDPMSSVNMLHIIMSSNEEVMAPMGLENERRFAIQRVNNSKIGKHTWFEKLHKELYSGGYSRLLWDLLHRDLGDWNPRKNIIVTKAAIEQKLRNLGPVEQWWINVLSEGEFPNGNIDNLSWKDNTIDVFKQEVRMSYDEHCKSSGIRSAGAMGRSVDLNFAQMWAKLVPNFSAKGVRRLVPADRFDIIKHNDGRTWAYRIPNLIECRNHVQKIIGGIIEWPDEFEDEEF